MLTALSHGNGLCGAWALKTLLASGLRPRQGSLTLAFCNLAAFDRFDSANYLPARFVDEDMNRVWSDDKLADPATQERRRAAALDRKSTRLNSSHYCASRMPSSA